MERTAVTEKSSQLAISRESINIGKEGWRLAWRGVWSFGRVMLLLRDAHFHLAVALAKGAGF